MIRSGVRLDQTASHQGRRIERAADSVEFVRDNFAAGRSPLLRGRMCPEVLSCALDFSAQISLGMNDVNRRHT